MTNAWIQRFLTLGSMLIFWSLAAWLWATQSAAALGFLLLPALITPLTLLPSFLLAALSNADAAAPRAGLSQWLRAWGAEWRVATQVFTWWQPFRHHAIADQLQPTPGQRGMVLVHGYFCNRALWTDWMAQLRKEGRVFVSVDLEPAFGSISDYASIIEKAVAQVEKSTGMPPVLVGHSMGGLAIRAWAARFVGANGSMRRIQRIFTLGTPHQGTAISSFAHTTNGREMRIASNWLTANTSQLPSDFAQHCTCYFSNCDNVVFPAHAATFYQADNHLVAGRAHVELICVDDIKQACWAALK